MKQFSSFLLCIALATVAFAVPFEAFGQETLHSGAPLNDGKGLPESGPAETAMLAAAALGGYSLWRKAGKGRAMKKA